MCAGTMIQDEALSPPATDSLIDSLTEGFRAEGFRAVRGDRTTYYLMCPTV
jgi:hypothetical protein